MAPRSKKPQLPQSTLKTSPTARFGDTLVNRVPRPWELATILDYNIEAQTYSIMTGTQSITNVPRLVNDPGETTILPRDTTVVIHYELGYPVIDKVFKQAPTAASELRPTRVSEIRGVGGEDPLYTASDDATSFHAPNDPSDVLPEDWVRRTKNGNFIGVLLGGTNVLHSAPMAQIRTHALDEMVEIISAQFRHLTDMGDLNIKNEGGKTSLTWYAGADQTVECGAGAGKWTIRLEVGAKGDLFTLRVTTPDGNDLAKFHMSANGRVEILGAAGIDFTSGSNGPMVEDVAANKVTRVSGDVTTTIKGAVKETLRKNRDTTVAKNDTHMVGNDLNETVSHDRNIIVNGVCYEKVQGGGPVPVPDSGAVAKKFEILNGSFLVEIANPKAALSGLKQAETHVNYVDGFNFVLMPSSDGKFVFMSKKDGCVMLGADGSATQNSDGSYTVSPEASNNAMMYQPWETFIKQVLQWIDKHQHGTAMGPSSPPIEPLTSSVENLYPKVKSKRVLIGA